MGIFIFLMIHLKKFFKRMQLNLQKVRHFQYGLRPLKVYSLNSILVLQPLSVEDNHMGQLNQARSFPGIAITCVV